MNNSVGLTEEVARWPLGARTERIYLSWEIKNMKDSLKRGRIGIAVSNLATAIGGGTTTNCGPTLGSLRVPQMTPLKYQR